MVLLLSHPLLRNCALLCALLFSISSIYSTSSSSTLSALQQDGTPQKPSQPKIFYAIFAGRERFMKIHLQYTEAMLARGMITQVHIWDFCFNENDEKYLIDTINRLNKNKPIINNTGENIDNSSSNDSSEDRLEKYVLFRPVSTFPRSRSIFKHFYDHYHSDTYSDNDIIIKADDDIVFIDLESFPGFLYSVTDNKLHFPLIINNDVSTVILATQKYHPLLSILYDKLYISRGFNISRKFDFIPYPGLCYSIPISNFCDEIDVYKRQAKGGTECSGVTFISGELPSSLVSSHNTIIQDDYIVESNVTCSSSVAWYMRSDLALLAHSLFLTDKDKFLSKSRSMQFKHQCDASSKITCQGSESNRFIDFGNRISINFFAVSVRDFRDVFFRNWYNFVGTANAEYYRNQIDDELFLASRILSLNRKHIIDTSLIVAHYLFTFQYNEESGEDSEGEGSEAIPMRLTERNVMEKIEENLQYIQLIEQSLQNNLYEDEEMIKLEEMSNALQSEINSLLAVMDGQLLDFDLERCYRIYESLI